MTKTELFIKLAMPDENHIQGYLPQANIILKPEFRGHEEKILPKINGGS